MLPYTDYNKPFQGSYDSISIMSTKVFETCETWFFTASSPRDDDSNALGSRFLPQVLGQAQSDAILTPAVTGAAMFMELASGAPAKGPMSLSQQETQVGTHWKKGRILQGCLGGGCKYC